MNRETPPRIGSALALRNASCMAPTNGEWTEGCGKRAVEQRVLGGVVWALCAEHAKEVDAEVTPIFVRPVRGATVDQLVDALAEPVIKWINEQRAKRGLPPLPKE